MSKVNIFWDPLGTSVDTIGTDKLDSITDGDTPYVTMAIRMLSIDTPELHYPSNSNPSKQDENLKQLATWIENDQAPINKDLGQYLKPKLETGNAGTLQGTQGQKAKEHFQSLLDTKLKKNGDSKPLFIRAADEHFDQYGRLLAYIAPHYTASERAVMTRKERATFNLLMVESGWAASFPIYPSIPGYPDLVLLREVAKDAFDNGKGAWADPLMLTGYEFRMCIKLYRVTKKIVVDGETLSNYEKYGWISRYCIDMTRSELYYPQDYFKVKPYDRIFVWPRDLVEAIAKMNLTPTK